MEERIMDKVIIVFWSQSGNTESMANAVAEGVTAAGKEAVKDKLTGNIVKEIYVPKKIINIVQK